MALHRRITTAARTLLGSARTLGAIAAGSVAVSLAVAGPALASTTAAHAATASPIIWGTLDTQPGTAATEDKAGVTMAMLELNWSSFEPKNGVVSASYLATIKSQLQAYQAAGMKVTLALGMHWAP